MNCSVLFSKKHVGVSTQIIKLMIICLVLFLLDISANASRFSEHIERNDLFWKACECFYRMGRCVKVHEDRSIYLAIHVILAVTC